MPDKTLPDKNSDYSLPGRIEDSNAGYYDQPVESKPKSRTAIVITVAFVLVSVGFFSYYFINQNEIDSQIIDKTTIMTHEEKMVNHYGVGEFGSDHAHAALIVFVGDEKINFGMSQFQLQSKYIHFENHNPYLIHKHATGVPLEMLFASFGLEITSECVSLSNKSDSIVDKKFCTDSEHSLVFIVNGEYHSDITEYEIVHNDRILISFGDSELIYEQLKYLASLEIHDIPKKNHITPGKDISV